MPVGDERKEPDERRPLKLTKNLYTWEEQI